MSILCPHLHLIKHFSICMSVYMCTYYNLIVYVCISFLKHVHTHIQANNITHVTVAPIVPCELSATIKQIHDGKKYTCITWCVCVRVRACVCVCVTIDMYVLYVNYVYVFPVLNQACATINYIHVILNQFNQLNKFVAFRNVWSFLCTGVAIVCCNEARCDRNQPNKAILVL